MNIKALNTGSEVDYPTIKKITIYGGGAELYSIEDYTLQQCRADGNGKIDTVYDGKVQTLILSQEPKRARKLNLSRKDNFFLTYSGRYSFESGLHLYIHESEIHVKSAGEYIVFDSSGETCFASAYTLHFAHGAEMIRCKVERVPDAGPGFIPPDGCKWSKDYSRDPGHPHYDIFKERPWAKDPGPTGVIKRWLEPETVSEILVKSSGYSRTEKNDDRKRREEIAETLNKARVFYREVSHYEIEKLLQLYDLIPKKDGENA